MTTLNVTSGITQGSNDSTTLFLQLTYLIILHLTQAHSSYRGETCFIPALFCADDGLLPAQCGGGAGHDWHPDRLCKHLWPRNQQRQCFIMVNNHNTQLDNMLGIKITNTNKYLWITVTKKRRCFKLDKANEARRLGNMTAAVEARSTIRPLVGTTCWKQVALPKILYCQGIQQWTRPTTKKRRKPLEQFYEP